MDGTNPVWITLLGIILTAIITAAGVILTFRGNLPKMAADAFALAQTALARVVELERQLAERDATMMGYARISGLVNVGDFVEKGYANIQNGIMERINEPEKRIERKELPI